MYGKVAIAAAGLLAAANARPHRYNPMTTTTGVPLSDIVHSTVPSASYPTHSASNTNHPVYPSSAYGTGSHGTGVSSSSGAYSTGGVGGGSKGGVFSFPLANGFPDVTDVPGLEQQAHGELSNGGAPTGFHDDTLNAVAFIAFNELFEVSYFAELVKLISSNAKGFTAADIAPADRDTVLANLKVILAQEELHALNAEAVLKANNRAPLAPCTYKFPVDNFVDAIGLASTFTDMVLGTLPDIQTVAAVDSDFGLVKAVGSVVGQEGEQNGFYRSILGKVPSQLPFLTGAARNFAFNAILQNFIAHCPAATLDALEQPAAGIPLNQTGTLTVLDASKLTLEDTTLSFSVQTVDVSKTHEYYTTNKSSMNFVTYVNQQNKPLSVPIDPTTISFANGEITFQASFPAKTEFINGFTIAAVTEVEGLADPDSVASAMTFGPGLIEID